MTVTANPPRNPKQARVTLILVFVLFAAPLAVAWVLNFTGDFRPAATTNHGTLIQPVRPMSAASLVDTAGAPVDPGLFEHHWTLVYRISGPCEDACRQALFVMRQVRLAQGKNIDRVQRLALLDAEPPPGWPAEILAHYPGLAIARPAPGTDASRLPAAGRISLVDPLGNLMMEYPADTDPRGMIKDLERLLRISYVG